MTTKLTPGRSYLINVAPAWVLTGTCQEAHEDPSGRVHYEIVDACWIERCTDVTLLTEAVTSADLDAIPRLWTRPISGGSAISVDDASITMAWPIHVFPTSRVKRG